MTEEVGTDVAPAVVDPELEEFEKAKANLMLAKQSHQHTSAVLQENANEFASPSADKALVTAAREAQMPNVVSWYKFWETAAVIPKDNMYATYTTNEKRTWKTIVEANEAFIREVVTDEGLTEVTWKKSLFSKGVSVWYSPEQSDLLKVRLYKAETVLKNTSPRLVLLSLVRGPVLGAADEDLVYFREHYNFVNNCTSLVHHARKVVASSKVSVRDFFDLTNWTEESDGTIFFTASSVKALPAKLPGVVRGATFLKAFAISPGPNDGEVKLTMISQVDPRGMVFNFVLNWYVPSMLVRELEAIQKASDIVRESGEEERLISKFVFRELDFDTEE